jgi:copper homeostasis protein
MPGAGVRSGNLTALINETGAWEYHTSARKLIPNPMSYANPLVSDAGNFYMADEQELGSIIQILKSHSAEVKQ